MEQYAAHAGQHTGAQRQGRGLLGFPGRAVTGPYTVEEQRSQQEQVAAEANPTHFHQDFQIVIVHVEVGHPLVNLMLHGHRAAEHTQSKAEHRVQGQISQRNIPTAAAAAVVVGGLEFRRQQEAQTAGNKGNAQRHQQGHTHERDQTAVHQQGKYQHRHGHSAPGGTGHGKQAGHTHAEGDKPAQELGPCAAAPVGETGCHGRKQHHKVTHDIGAAEDREDAGTDRAFGISHPFVGNGNRDNKLINAVEGNKERGGHQGYIQQGEVPVVAQKPGHQEEPQHVLHRSPIAGNADGEERRGDQQQGQTHGNKKEYRGVQRGNAAENGPGVEHTPIDHPQQSQQHQAFVPNGGQDRDSENIPQKVVQNGIQSDGYQQHSGHTAAEQPAQAFAVPTHRKDGVVGAVEQTPVEGRRQMPAQTP